MQKRKVDWRIRILLSLVLAVSWNVLGCASTQVAGSGWPTDDVVPAESPEDLDTSAASTVLRRGPDGFLYAVGGVPSDASAGTPFLARYSGDWPLEETRRPPLAAGRVVRTVGGDSAVVHLTYRMPETDVTGLEVSWEENIHAAAVGKGIGQVKTVERGDETVATLTLGEKSGVQPGDIYAIVAPPSTIDTGVDVQLSRRFKAICYVREASKSSATCRVRKNEGDGSETVARADETVFLQHVLDRAPRRATIRVGALGDEASEDSAAAHRAVVESFRTFAANRSEANVEIEAIDTALSATRDDFHRVENELEHTARPQLAVGLETVEREGGSTHLVANYTGIGPSTGSGMVAAPPTGGVDLGPVDSLRRREVRGFVATVWAGVLVYRGQDARALAFLHDRLSGRTLEGPLRWHARDQYAMRWGAFEHYGEAMWLVRQDRAVAREKFGPAAVRNAEGTLVRLYDFVGLTGRAVEAARAFRDGLESEKPGTEWLAAVGMLAELQAADGDLEAAEESVAALEEACPEGCSGDLFSYLSSVWWSIEDPEKTDLSERLLSTLLEIGARRRGRELAAARLYQALDAMRAEQFDQALVGFLESARLYESQDHLVGLARARYFEMIAQIRREERQSAFDAGQTALDLRKKLRDFDGLARTYNRLSSVYANIDLEKRPGPYLRSARSVLTNAYESQRALGSFGKAGESLYTLGSFLVQFGQNSSAQPLLRKAVGFSVSATRFDIAALSHLHLAIIARRNNQQNQFRKEAERARIMAELAESPRIKEMVDRALNPDREREEDDPTQML